MPLALSDLMKVLVLECVFLFPFRRVLRDYFNYDVFFVENITDIDDKIIRRARQNHLFERYVADDPDLSRVIADCNEVSVAFGETVKKTTDPDKKTMQVIPFVFKKMCLNFELKLFFDTGEAVQDPDGGRGEGRVSGEEGLDERAGGEGGAAVGGQGPHLGLAGQEQGVGGDAERDLLRPAALLGAEVPRGHGRPQHLAARLPDAGERVRARERGLRAEDHRLRLRLRVQRVGLLRRGQVRRRPGAPLREARPGSVRKSG